jgi:DNA-binding CsgD family transcriptional regulator
VTPEEVYIVAAEARGAEIDVALRSFSASARIRNPLAVALRAMRSATEGDVPGAIALLRRGLSVAEGAEKQYLLELLAPLLTNSGCIEEAEQVLSEADLSVPMLVPAFDAIRAIVAARQGQDAASTAFARQAVAGGRAADNWIIAGRVLTRTATAAFYRENFDEAQDRALEAARLYERFESHRNAAMAYSILYIIAHEWTCDLDLARFYARRMTMSAHLANDATMENRGLLAQIGIAADSGDSRRLRALRAKLLAKPLNEQFHRERFVFVIAEALLLGWSARFDAARAVLTSLRQRDLALGERALCDALLSIVSISVWDTDTASRLARRTISQTVERRGSEPLFEARARRTARMLAAAVCIVLGDTVRGARALSRAVDPEQKIASRIGPYGIGEAGMPTHLQGFVKFLNAACHAAESVRPTQLLTAAELEVMRALPGGMTLATIASTLGKSRKTVERQVGSIYAKLQVANRAQAIQRARDLGINA